MVTACSRHLCRPSVRFVYAPPPTVRRPPPPPHTHAHTPTHTHTHTFYTPVHNPERRGNALALHTTSHLVVEAVADDGEEPLERELDGGPLSWEGVEGDLLTVCLGVFWGFGLVCDGSVVGFVGLGFGVLGVGACCVWVMGAWVQAIRDGTAHIPTPQPKIRPQPTPSPRRTDGRHALT